MLLWLHRGIWEAIQYYVGKQNANLGDSIPL